MLLLGVHSGWSDAGAALFDDYRLLAAVPLSRISGMAHDGGRLPVEAIADCLEIANVRPGDVAGLALSRGVFPGRHYRALSLPRRVSRSLRHLLGRDTPISLAQEAQRKKTSAESLLDLPMLAGDLGLNRHIPTRLYTHHAAHALLALNETTFTDGLIFTADNGADGTAYSAQVLKFGRLASFYSDGVAAAQGQAALGQLVDLAVAGLDLPDPSALFALAQQGEPVFAQALHAHVRVDADGHILSDFAADGGAERWLRALAEGHPPALIAASLTRLIADILGLALTRLLQRHELSALALGGSLFADPWLLQALQQRLPDVTIRVMAASDDTLLPLGGALDYLLQRDGVDGFLRGRRPLRAADWGRDYAADIDPVLANAGCRLVSRDPLQAAAALLHAGKTVAAYGRRAGGSDGGAARVILFSGALAGAAANVNLRLDRPGFLAPKLYAPREALADLVPGSDSQDPAMAQMLAERWRPQLPAALASGTLLQVAAVDEQAQPLLHDLLTTYKALSWLPALLGVPMQVGQEPVLDAPGEVIRLLQDDRVDYLVTEHAVWEKG